MIIPPIPPDNQDLADFYQTFSSRQAKRLLWELYKSAACGNFNTFLEVDERTDISILIEKLHQLITAGELIYKATKKQPDPNE